MASAAIAALLQRGPCAIVTCMKPRMLQMGLVFVTFAGACSSDKRDVQTTSNAPPQTTTANPGPQTQSQDVTDSLPPSAKSPSEMIPASVPRTLTPLPPNPGNHTGKHLWSTAISGPGVDASRDVAIDSKQRVAVTGYVAKGANFGDGSQIEAAKYDAFVATYDSNGTLLWRSHFGGSGEDVGNAVAFDSDGNTVVAGLFATAMTVGDTALTAAGSDDIFVAKFAPDGTPLWARQLGGSNSDGAHDVAIDADGTIYVTGSFAGTMQIADQTLDSKGNEDIFLLRLTAAGEIQWGKRFGERKRDFGQRVTVDGQGHVILLAEFGDEVGFGGAVLTSAGNRDLAVVKLSAAGDHLWSKRFGSPFNEFGLGLAVDPAGNIALTGSFDQEITFGGAKLVSRGESDVYVAKLAPDGAHLWSRAYGAAREDIGYGIATDQYGNVAVIGWFWQQVDFGGGTLKAAGPNKDIFLLKLSDKGKHLWSRRFGAADHDQGRGVAMTPAGVAAATGLFRFSLDLGGAPLESSRNPADKAPPPDAFIGLFAP